jgi:hypothetical protein
VISNFREEVDENYVLLGYYSANSVIPYQLFGITYWSHLQRSRIQKESQELSYGVYIRNNVGGGMFSVVWCQPIGLMQEEGGGYH